ncbi:MAG: hypothetical protein J1F64_00735 [Oscillospiraceae bacterium]|nr:hypothetical protein [Oscillospiraceae bacterium]
MTYNELREKYKNFFFIGYDIRKEKDKIYVRYEFETEGLAEFAPEWTFVCGEDFDPRDKTLDALVFSLGMVELISYWKITCPPNVYIKCGYLDEYQKSWWKKQYFSGLGEFFYTNGINDADIDDFMNIIPEGGKHDRCDAPQKGAGVLIPIGGGKDSAVTIELLKDVTPRGCYIINPRGATVGTAEAAGFDEKEIIAVSRTLDKNMLALNKEGIYLNGHTPFSAIVAFSSVIEAYLGGYEYVALSNEASANESTVSGSDVNHQYSKSFDFEKDFCEYESKYINSGVRYFSMLRAWSEYEIAEYFSRLKRYHKVFRSCNAGSREDKWCCNCPKCLFVYLILSPFLSPGELEEIFGENLADKEELSGDFKKLIGEVPEKPFECVGSRDEVNTAVCAALERYGDGDKLPVLFEYYKKTPFYEQYRGRKNPYTDYFNEENLIPDIFREKLRKHRFKGNSPGGER